LTYCGNKPKPSTYNLRASLSTFNLTRIALFANIWDSRSFRFSVSGAYVSGKIATNSKAMANEKSRPTKQGGNAEVIA